MQEVKIRLVNPALSPRRTKLEMPGWAGQPEPRADGAQEYAWHCAPFAEGAQYGIEVFYPYDNELRVSKQQGKLVLDGDFGLLGRHAVRRGKSEGHYSGRLSYACPQNLPPRKVRWHWAPR